MIVGFDHCYQRIIQASEYQNLKLRGFTTQDAPFEHPGKRFCRFIHFQKKEDPGWGLPFQYLEFVEVQDLNEFKLSFPPGTPERKMNEPGFSLAFGHDLERIYESVREPLQRYEPTFEHKNYQWKESATDRLPGWNFLTFKNNIVPDIYVWGTEYEPVPGTTRSGTVPGHANTANYIHGFVWDLEMADLQNFIKISRLQVRESGMLEFHDGLKLFLNAHAELPLEVKESNKQYPFKAVILKAGDWDQFLTHGQPDQVFKWRGKKVGVIQMNSAGWDIWVIE